MPKPLVSVCCLTYNHEPYISDCIEGFLLQKTNFTYEVLIHDDASTDKTPKIIREYEKKYPDIIKPIYQKSNQYSRGVRPTFEFNIPRAKGKYIALCEGEDYWTDPLKLQKQVDFLESHKDFVGVFHSTDYIDEREKNSKPKLWRQYKRDVYSAKDTIRKTSLFHTSSYCFRNLNYDFSLLNNSRIVSADMLLLGIISKFGKLKLLHDTMSVYRRNFGGVTSSESKIKYHKNRIALNKTLNAYFDYQYNTKAQQVINYHKNELVRLKWPKLYKAKKKIKNKLSKLK